VEFHILQRESQTALRSVFESCAAPWELAENTALVAQLRRIASRRPYMALGVRLVAADLLVAIGCEWQCTRLLLLATRRMSNCAHPLALLPDHLVRIIMRMYLISP